MIIRLKLLNLNNNLTPNNAITLANGDIAILQQQIKTLILFDDVAQYKYQWEDIPLETGE